MSSRDTVRWAVCGPGGVAQRFAEAMRLVEGGHIVAVASRSLDRAKAFADRFGIPTPYGSADELAADPGVDVVYVATPPANHLSDTVRFLEGGKHVLCEKPFALSAADAEHMAHAARTRGLFCMEAMWSRFLPAYRLLASVLADGTIGDPLLVEADLGSRMQLDSSHRLLDPARGGGALRDAGIYPVQLCSLVLGAPDRVAGDCVTGPTGVDVQVAAVLHHAGGQLGVVKAAICVELGRGARISGSRGLVEIPAFMNAPKHLTVTRAGRRETLDAPFGPGALRYEIDEVHRCLAAGLTESSVMSLHETVSIVQTLDGISARMNGLPSTPDDERDGTG